MKPIESWKVKLLPKHGGIGSFDVKPKMLDRIRNFSEEKKDENQDDVGEEETADVGDQSW